MKPADFKSPEAYLADAKEHHITQLPYCDCKMIPECVAHFALKELHYMAVVRPHMLRQQVWWRRAWRWLVDRYHPSPYSQGYGSNL